MAILLPEFSIRIGVQEIQNLRQPQKRAVEFPRPALMILSINLPFALLRIILKQSDIDDSSIGVNVPRTARAFYAIPTGHRVHLWQDIAVSLSRPKRTLDTLLVEIIWMGKSSHRYLFKNCCFHG
jgi:hypothetical protein